MSAAVAEWLPDNAYSEGAVKAVIGSLIQEWGRAWFASGSVSIALLDGIGAAAAGGMRLQLQQNTGWVDLSSRGKRRVIEAIVGSEPADANECDRRLLDALLAEILEDLVARLDKFFSLSKPITDDRHVRIGLILGSDQLADVMLACSPLVPHIKKTFTPCSKVHGAVAGRGRALAMLPIRTEAILGRAVLSIGDLEGLRAGDVLVLDRATDGPVELRLSGCTQVFARGRLQRKDGRTVVQL